METERNETEHIRWLSDLIRLEIVLWERIDSRLKVEHNLPLAYFESLYFIVHAPGESIRVGDLAEALRVTVGGTSKLVDRIERAGLIRREPDPTDRRAALVVLTPAGSQAVTVASKTYEAEMAIVLDAVFSVGEQRHMHALMTRLLTTMTRLEAKDHTSLEMEKEERSL